MNVADELYPPCVTVWGEEESRNVVPAAFWCNHATPSDIIRSGRTMNHVYSTRCVCWLLNGLAFDRDEFIGC